MSQMQEKAGRRVSTSKDGGGGTPSEGDEQQQQQQQHPSASAMAIIDRLRESVSAPGSRPSTPARDLNKDAPASEVEGKASLRDELTSKVLEVLNGPLGAVNSALVAIGTTLGTVIEKQDELTINQQRLQFTVERETQLLNDLIRSVRYRTTGYQTSNEKSLDAITQSLNQLTAKVESLGSQNERILSEQRAVVVATRNRSVGFVPRWIGRLAMFSIIGWMLWRAVWKKGMDWTFWKLQRDRLRARRLIS